MFFDDSKTKIMITVHQIEFYRIDSLMSIKIRVLVKFDSCKIVGCVMGTAFASELIADDRLF